MIERFKRFITTKIKSERLLIHHLGRRCDDDVSEIKWM